jgi:hypothetical protein
MTDTTGTDTGESVLFAEPAGYETDSRWDGGISEGVDGDAQEDRCEPVTGRSCLVDQHLPDLFTYSGMVLRCYSMHTCTAGRISLRWNSLNQAIGWGRKGKDADLSP